MKLLPQEAGRKLQRRVTGSHMPSTRAASSQLGFQADGLYSVKQDGHLKWYALRSQIHCKLSP